MTERKSNFTGKSDFFDWCNMHNTPKDVLKKANVFLNGAKLSLNKPEDLIPYYNHAIASMALSGGKEKQLINLGKESYLDSIEKDHISYIIYDCIMWARKARKAKKDFNLNFIKSQKNYDVCYSSIKDCILNAVIDQINEYPNLIKFHVNRINIDIIKEYLLPHYFWFIHDNFTTRRREEFVKYAGENGYHIFHWDFENNKMVEKNGEYSPIIWETCLKIKEYQRIERGLKAYEY